MFGSWLTGQADVLQNLANNLAPVQRLITGGAYIMGIGFAIKAMYAMRTFGEHKAASSGHSNAKEPLLYLLIAAVFIYFPTGIQVMLNTTFGTSSILEYSPTASSNGTINTLFGNSAIGAPLTLIIRTIGLWAFVKGWLMIARSASGSGGGQQGGTGKGFIHVFGGILAINIVQTIDIINNTLFVSQ